MTVATALPTVRGLLLLFCCFLAPQKVQAQTPTFPLLMSSGEIDPAFTFTDSKGAIWGYDRYNGGTGSPSNVVAEVVKTTDDPIFQKQRFGTTLGYSIPAPRGTYKVTLYMAEMSLQFTGGRVMDIFVEGVLTQDNVDMFAMAGRRRSAILLVQNTNVTDGMLDISFVAVAGMPTVAGVRVDQIALLATSKPSTKPSSMPSKAPSRSPSRTPSRSPSRTPSRTPSRSPSRVPSSMPSRAPIKPPTPSEVFPLYINAGETNATATFTDISGAVWGYDKYYGATGTASNVVAGVVKTVDDLLFQKQRFGIDVVYAIPAASGEYRVSLYLAEMSINVPGQRVFDIEIEGVVTQDNFDMFAFAGRRRSAIILEQDVSVTDNVLNIALRPVVGIPTLAAIKVTRYPPHIAHAVGGGPYAGVDVNNIGSALIPVDGSFSHTHGPGLSLSSWTWMKGTTVLASGQTAILNLAVGVHTVTLKVVDTGNNEATDSFQVTVFSFGYPVLSSVSPPQGALVGGDTIVLTGSGFNYTESSIVVQFGAANLTGPSQITVLSPTTIRVLSTPASAFAVPVDIMVTTPRGTSNAQKYTYIEGVPIVFTNGTVIATAQPTRIAFGPDGKMYVSTYGGIVYKLTLNANYQVVESVISNVIPLAYPGRFRPVLGIAFDPTDTKPNPDVYVSHSTIFHGSSSAYLGAAINGKVSKLSGANLDTITDVVTGLPVCDRDHAVNGLFFGNNGDLYIQIGGNTNAGVPGALSGSGIQQDNVLGSATLVAHVKMPNFNGALSYDSATGALLAGSHVEVYSSGERNPFGIVQHSNGNLYGTDNGPNGGFGQKSTSCATGGGDPTEPDKLNLLKPGTFYGHANRNRGECVWRSSSEASSGVYKAALVMLPSSTDGIVEFDSAHFGGQLRGDLIVGQYQGKLYRVKLDSTGESVLSGPTILVTGGDLDVTQGPDGTLFVAQISKSKIIFHKPSEPAAISVTLKSVFPRRGPLSGGSSLSLYGEILTSVGSPTTVLVGSSPCPIMSANVTKLVCSLPPGSGLVDVTVSYGSSYSILKKAYRYV
jgi:glucose/arabinose dehydrogenase